MLWNLALILVQIDLWFIFKKMGHKGWEGVIPFYNYFLLFKDIYGSGERAFTLLIPFYNIYVYFKLWIDIGTRFHQESWFGIGCAGVAPVFLTMLAFGKQEYLDGTCANKEADVLTNAYDKVKAVIDQKRAEIIAKESMKENSAQGSNTAASSAE